MTIEEGVETMERVEGELHQVEPLTVDRTFDDETLDSALDDVAASLESDSGFMRDNIRLVGIAAVLLALVVVVVAVALNRSSGQSISIDG